MFKVYSTTPNGIEHAMTFGSDEMTQALNYMQKLRESGDMFVTMASENPEQVGKMGVNAVKDGKLPDGTEYDWTKRDRVGAAFKTAE